MRDWDYGKLYDKLSEKERLTLHFAFRHFENDLKDHPMILGGIASNTEITMDDAMALRLKLGDNITSIDGDFVKDYTAKVISDAVIKALRDKHT